MDKATKIAMKQNTRLSNKDTKDALNKNKPEKLSHAEVQALIDTANVKKKLDEFTRFQNDKEATLVKELSELKENITKRVAAIEDEVKNIKKEKSK